MIGLGVRSMARAAAACSAAATAALAFAAAAASCFSCCCCSLSFFSRKLFLIRNFICAHLFVERCFVGVVDLHFGGLRPYPLCLRPLLLSMIQVLLLHRTRTSRPATRLPALACDSHRER